MKILAGTDFSRSGDEAVRSAAALCRGLEASLVIASAYEPLAARGLVTTGEAALELDVQLRSLVEDGLEQTVERCGVAALEPTRLPLEGAPADALAAAAAETGADLLVVGSHGHSALGRWLLGSVADRLSDRTPIPLLVVHGGAERFERWLEEARPLRIVVGADLTRATTAAIELLRRLRERTPVDVTFVNVYWPPVEYERLGLEEPGAIDLPDPEVASSLQTAIEKRVGRLPGTGRVEIRVWPGMGGIGRALDHEAELMDADLVLVGSHQRHGLARLWRGSHAREVLHHVRRSVLCVPQRILAHRLEPLQAPRVFLVGTDLSEQGDLAIRHALALAPPGARLQLVHVLEGESGEEASLREQMLGLVEAEALRRGVDVRVEVLHGEDPASGLLEAAERIDADVVVIGSGGKTGLKRILLGSTAEALVRQSRRPLYLVPPPQED